MLLTVTVFPEPACIDENSVLESILFLAPPPINAVEPDITLFLPPIINELIPDIVFPVPPKIPE